MKPNITRPEHYEPHRTRYIYDLRHPTKEDMQDFVAIRRRAVALADEIGSRTRVCAAQSLALRKVREAIHVAEEAILGDRSRRRIVEKVEPQGEPLYLTTPAAEAEHV